MLIIITYLTHTVHMSRADKNYASVLERERAGDPQSISSVLNPEELGPFLDAIDQIYTPTVSNCVHAAAAA